MPASEVTLTLVEPHAPSADDANLGEKAVSSSQNGTEDLSQKDTAPDGGLAAWLMVFGAWCALFCSFGWLNSIGTFQSYYETKLLPEYPASTIAWVPSLQIFFMFAMAPIVGKLYDDFGPRYVVLTGSLLHVFGLMMASISKEYYQILLSQGVCSAMGVCAIFQPAMNCIPSWFNKKRGIVYGIVSSGSSVGGVIFPIMLSRLIQQVGYEWAMRIAAFMIMGLLIITTLTVRSRVPPKPRTMDKESLIRPFRDPKMVLIIVGYLFLTFGVFVPINYLEIQAIDAGMQYDLAQYLVALFNAASLFGRITGGASSDKIGVYNIFVSVCYVAGILVLVLWVPANCDAASIAFAIFFGFVSGAYVSLSTAIVVHISPFTEIGYRTGLLFLFASIGGMTTNPIAGAILQNTGGSYIGMKIFAGLLLLAGSTLVLAARIHKTGFVLKAKF